MPTSIVYRSFAKINLYLDVLNRRRDGYHNIETLFQTVNLADRMTFTERETGIELDCSEPQLANPDTNLAGRAARMLQERTGYGRGVHIEIEKHIPIAAGLAGGSGNAAATLVALNDLWDLELSMGQLKLMALELGSDVPYCLEGGAFTATGRGEELMRIAPLPAAWFVLVHPPIAVSTPRVYNSPNLRRNDAPRFAGRTRGFRIAVHSLMHGRYGDGVFNAMESAVFADHPTLEKIKHLLVERGCITAAMSGSGPTLFGVCDSRRNAMRIAESLEEYETSVVSPVPYGLERG